MNHEPQFDSDWQDATSPPPSTPPNEGGEERKEETAHRTLILHQHATMDFLFDFDEEIARGSKSTILIEDSTGLSPHFVDRLIRDYESVYVAGNSVRLLANQLSQAEVKSARRVWRIAVLAILLGFVGLLMNQLSF
jgi:hypothetical protein